MTRKNLERNNGEGFLEILRFFMQDAPEGHYLYLPHAAFDLFWSFEMPWNTSINYRPTDARHLTQMQYAAPLHARGSCSQRPGSCSRE